MGIPGLLEKGPQKLPWDTLGCLLGVPGALLVALGGGLFVSGSLQGRFHGKSGKFWEPFWLNFYIIFADFRGIFGLRFLIDF